MKPLPFTLFITCVGSFALVSILSVVVTLSSQPPRSQQVFIDLPIADQGSKYRSSRGSFIVNLSTDGTLRLADGKPISVSKLGEKLSTYCARTAETGYSAYITLRADRTCRIGDVREIYDVAVSAGCGKMRFRVYRSERV